MNRHEPITFFEMLTAASFLAMSRIPADYVLLETGMGGRLDATNVVPDPICTIITTISKDHEKFLGDTVQQIAFEKAGIMKAGVPCVIGMQTYTDVFDVFHKKSTSLTPEAKLHQFGAHWNIEVVQGRMKFTWQDDSIAISHLNLIGPHQIYNMGAAITAYRLIMGRDFDVKILSPDNPKTPLLTVFWPGRLQKLESVSFQNMIGDNQELWVDGGHNDSAGMVLACQAGQWCADDNKSLHLIIAMVNRKNPADFLTPLLPYVDSVTVTSIPDEVNSYTVDELYALVKPMGFKKLTKAFTFEEAVEGISSDPDNDNARILATGSLYFVGTILA